MEGFFATLKAECANKVFTSKLGASSTIVEYIEAWYNRHRLYSTLDYRSPMELEFCTEHKSCPLYRVRTIYMFFYLTISGFSINVIKIPGSSNHHMLYRTRL
jgi:hypothetical protein